MAGTRRRFSAEFKREAVELARRDGVAVCLELAHDALVAPPQNLLAFSLALVVGLPWTVYDRVVLPRETTHPNRFMEAWDMMRASFFGPEQRAGPDRLAVVERIRRIGKGRAATYWFGCMVAGPTSMPIR